MQEDKVQEIATHLAIDVSGDLIETGKAHADQSPLKATPTKIRERA